MSEEPIESQILTEHSFPRMLVGTGSSYYWLHRLGLLMFVALFYIAVYILLTPNSPFEVELCRSIVVWGRLYDGEQHGMAIRYVHQRSFGLLYEHCPYYYNQTQGDTQIPPG